LRIASAFLPTTISRSMIQSVVWINVHREVELLRVPSAASVI
jgi:hypothetical protein